MAIEAHRTVAMHSHHSPGWPLLNGLIVTDILVLVFPSSVGARVPKGLE
jgi:hypothetical protein